jgi:hypothetical protein
VGLNSEVLCAGTCWDTWLFCYVGSFSCGFVVLGSETKATLRRFGLVAAQGFPN